MSQKCTIVATMTINNNTETTIITQILTILEIGQFLEGFVGKVFLGQPVKYQQHHVEALASFLPFKRCTMMMHNDAYVHKGGASKGKVSKM